MFGCSVARHSGVLHLGILRREEGHEERLGGPSFNGGRMIGGEEDLDAGIDNAWMWPGPVENGSLRPGSCSIRTLRSRASGGDESVSFRMQHATNEREYDEQVQTPDRACVVDEGD